MNDENNNQMINKGYSQQPMNFDQQTGIPINAIRKKVDLKIFGFMFCLILYLDF